MRKVIVAVAVVVVVAGGGLAYWLMAPEPGPPPASQPQEPAAEAKPAPPDNNLVPAEQALEFPPTIDDESSPAIAETPETPSIGQKVRVFGTVTDARTGAAIPDASVQEAGVSEAFREALTDGAFDEENLSSVTYRVFGDDFSGEGEAVRTDASGAFSIEVDANSRSLSCQAEGYADASLRLKELDEGDTRVDFQLVPEATIAGSVVSETGEGIGEVWVEVEDVRESSFYFDATAFEYSEIENVTKADGSFAIAGLPPGNYRLLANPSEAGYLFDAKKAPVVNLAEGEHLGGIVLTVSLGGTVTGTVRDVDGRPIEGADVNASYTVSYFTDSMDYLDDPPFAIADADGNYTLRAVPLNVELRFVADHDDWSASTTDPMRLADALVSERVDFVLKQGSSVSGTVVDAEGAPVKGVDVMLSLSGSAFMYDPNGMDWMESDEEGVFTFTHVAPGLYTVETDNTEMEIEVAEGRDVSNLRIVSTKSPEASEVIEGIVLGLDGAPQAGVKVSLRSLFMGYTFDETVTAEDGTFKLTDVSAFATTVEAIGEDSESFFVPSMYELRAQSEDGYATERNIVLGAKNTLRLRPAVQVSGIVLTADGEPAPHCPVELIEASDGNEPSGENMFAVMAGPFGAMFGDEGAAETDASGQFVLKNVEPGRYTVEAVSKTQGAGESAQFAVTETSGPGNVTVTLERGVSFAGRVSGPKGQPIAGALVELYRSKGQDGFAGMAEPLIAGMLGEAQGAGTSDAQGRFAIQNVPHGVYLVRASHTDLAPFVGRDVSLTPGRDVSGYAIAMSRGGGVRGVVTHAGAPTTGAMVMVSNDEAMRQALTDPEGRFEITGLAAGTYMVMSMPFEDMDSDGEFMPRPQSVTVVADQISEIEIATGLGVAVSGTVTGVRPAQGQMMIRLKQDGAMDTVTEPISNADPMAFMAMMDFANMAPLEDDGTFSLPDVNPGTYTLEVFVFSPVVGQMLEPDFESLMDAFSEPIYAQAITVGNEPLTVEVVLP